MLDLGTIIGIISLVFTAILATHISVSSNCWGLNTRVESKNGTLEIDIEYESEEIRASIDEKTGAISIQLVDLSNNTL